jgi:hypothetical protein
MSGTCQRHDTACGSAHSWGSSAPHLHRHTPSPHTCEAQFDEVLLRVRGHSTRVPAANGRRDGLPVPPVLLQARRKRLRLGSTPCLKGEGGW